MKIQCSCGTKFSFDVTPEMASQPVQFICQNCGLDNSVVVNQLIRKELGLADVPTAVAVPAAATPATPAPSAPRPAVRLSSTHAVSTAPATPGKAPVLCLKHPGQEISHHCVVCQKPMCPVCMEQFGYVCSPYCKTKAENQGIAVPAHARQKSVVEARQWRKTGLLTTAVAAGVVALLGLWFWYAWFGSVPGVKYSARFATRASTGQVRFAGPDNLVLLHGVRLARHDLKQKREIWSVDLLDRQTITNFAKSRVAALQEERDRLQSERPDVRRAKPVSLEDTADRMLREAGGALALYVSGHNIWVARPNKLTRYEWEAGKPTAEIQLGATVREPRREGDVLLVTTERDAQHETIKHINLATGEETTERIAKPPTAFASAPPNGPARPGAADPSSSAPRPPGPASLSNRAQSASGPARLALPATIAAALNQERLNVALNDGTMTKAEMESVIYAEGARVFSTPDGYAQFEIKLIERIVVEREAMKPPPAKSALNGNTSASSGREVATEMLNEMQRSRGSTVKEDHSRYQVTLRRLGKETPAWTAEVVGPPGFFPLRTVDLVAAGTTVMAIDRENKKRWEAKLNFPVPQIVTAYGEPRFEGGDGPCLERGDSVYILDAGVISAFDTASGNRRWSLPAIGTAGLLFDDEGMLYVNTTTADPESIKYSKQIDVGSPSHATILKVDPKTGKTLWQATGSGHVTYLSGPFIYSAAARVGDDPDAAATTGFEESPRMVILRLSPSNGRTLWMHKQERYPLDVQFDRNTIQLLFKGEVQFLKFITL